MEKLSTQSYKGARDFYPKDMQLRNYIFETWKRVCVRYGFEEYDFPILEPLEIFASKTGEEIVNNQLFSFEDKAGRKLAIRPELTPGTVRLIAQKFNELAKPIKWFMIGNNWRYEKPQVGRGREFYQLEVNTFGSKSAVADYEIFSIIIDIMREFGATKEQFELRFSDRKLINALLQNTLDLNTTTAETVRRIMDKYTKVDVKVFNAELIKVGLTTQQANIVQTFMQSTLEGMPTLLKLSKDEMSLVFADINNLQELLIQNNLMEFCRFDPTIIRGFDYSDGIVYEVFDKNPNNRRSLFGGERFDKLINIFGNFDLPATGFAMGDWTLKEFLTNWDLLPTKNPQAEFLVTVWPTKDNQELKFLKAAVDVCNKLRAKGKVVFMWTDTQDKLDKQLKYADKKNIPFAIIIGDQEIETDNITIKTLANQEQRTLKIEEFLKLI